MNLVHKDLKRLPTSGEWVTMESTLEMGWPKMNLFKGDKEYQISNVKTCDPSYPCAKTCTTGLRCYILDVPNQESGVTPTASCNAILRDKNGCRIG